MAHSLCFEHKKDPLVIAHLSALLNAQTLIYSRHLSNFKCLAIMFAACRSLKHHANGALLLAK